MTRDDLARAICYGPECIESCSKRSDCKDWRDWLSEADAVLAWLQEPALVEKMARAMCRAGPYPVDPDTPSSASGTMSYGSGLAITEVHERAWQRNTSAVRAAIRSLGEPT